MRDFRIRGGGIHCLTPEEASEFYATGRVASLENAWKPSQWVVIYFNMKKMRLRVIVTESCLTDRSAKENYTVAVAQYKDFMRTNMAEAAQVKPEDDFINDKFDIVISDSYEHRHVFVNLIKVVEWSKILVRKFDSYKKFKCLPDDNLYVDNEFCLHYLKKDAMNVQKYQNQEMTGQVFHAYWHGLVGEKHAFSIKSVLATQVNSKVCLWIDKESWNVNKNNPILRDLNKYIEIKYYDVYVEIKHTPFESLSESHWSQYIDLALRGDVFRIIILYKYKGVYFDLDMFFLRDIGTLYENHIIYCWECQNWCNNAMLFFKSEKILENIVASVKEYDSFRPWVIFNYNNVKLNELLVYPCAFFDPIWNITNIDKYDYPIRHWDDFFTKRCDMKSFKEFFPGTYAYHWHNRWNMEPVAGSFYDVFNKELINTVCVQ